MICVRFLIPSILATLMLFAGATALAQDTSPATSNSAYVFNSLLFLISGMVVMFMAAGFCMLEVGLVRAKNAASICVKNIALYSIASIMVWVTGYNIIYSVADGGLIAPFTEWFIWDADPLAQQIKDGRSSHAEWYFQMVFVATAASIVSGTLAERIRLLPFLIFVVVLTGFIYPLQAAWVWGGGILHTMLNFSDFAGSTLVHSAGGWAALAGAIILGARKGKFQNGAIKPMPGSSMPLATLGTLILWFGWFGFNGGSQLAAGSVEDISSVAKVFVNTNTSAAAGVVMAMIMSNLIYKKVDLTVVLNGAIGGLVSITAEPLMPEIWQAVVIGGFGGVIVTLAIPLLYRLKIDDVVGAIPAHLFCGIWGTLVVVWSKNASTVPEKAPTLLGQLAGVLMIGIFVFGMSLLIWMILKHTIGLRVSQEEEQRGLDHSELGLDAYPEFTGPR